MDNLDGEDILNLDGEDILNSIHGVARYNLEIFAKENEDLRAVFQ